jgi:hypothetical protein
MHPRDGQTPVPRGPTPFRVTMLRWGSLAWNVQGAGQRWNCRSFPLATRHRDLNVRQCRQSRTFSNADSEEGGGGSPLLPQHAGVVTCPPSLIGKTEADLN